jgi:lipoyl(octanoyl) transferase
MSALLYINLGLVDFLDAVRLQDELVGLRRTGHIGDVLLLVEHPHVYTLGRGGNTAHVIQPGNVPLHRTSRGGDVTYHGPGQLVVYPILDLRSKLRKDVHRYVRKLEQSAIQTLAGFGIAALRRPPFTGIWIGDRKIAAIGVAVRRAVTYHGLALNVNTDLSYFGRIIPCGLAWADVTSMAKELGTEQNIDEVRERFLHHFAEVFGYTQIEKSNELFDSVAVQTSSGEQTSKLTIETAGTFGTTGTL